MNKFWTNTVKVINGARDRITWSLLSWS